MTKKDTSKLNVYASIMLKFRKPRHEKKWHDICALLVRIFGVLEKAVLDHLFEHEGSLIHTRYIAKMKLRRYCFSIASKIPFSYGIQTSEIICDNRVTKQANKIIK